MSEKEETPAPVSAKDFAYLHERLKPLGWTEENNLVEIEQHQAAKDGSLGKTVKVKVPLFDVDEEGNILIHYFNVNGTRTTFKRGGETWSKPYVQKRWRVPHFNAAGKEMKYENPYGTAPRPWIPPSLITAYAEARKLDTLFLTEGAIKAFAGHLNGLYIVGLTSISTYAESKSVFTLPVDVIEIIKRCKPKQVVWLADGDCRDLSKEWTKMVEAEAEAHERNTNVASDPEKLPDLYNRPKNFFNSADKIRELLKDYGDIDVYFAHIDSPKVATNPKGLDDLFLAHCKVKGDEAAEAQRRLFSASHKGKPLTGAKLTKAKKEHEVSVELARESAVAQARREIVEDMTAYSGGMPHFIYRMNITGGLSRLRNYFSIGGHEQFYRAYQERIGERVFKYYGSTYRYIAGKDAVEMVVPGASKDFARVGDVFYEWVMSPRKMRDGTIVLERVLDSRQVTTIKADFNQEFLKHIPKYKRFCNMPDHTNYQQIVHNCLNLYYPFEHKSEAGDCPATMRYLSHIFGNGTIQATHPKKKDESGTRNLRYTVRELDLGLDYIQLLYQRPEQILPILCLVSNERNTGKTTLAKWLKLLFTSNAVMVGNSDFENDFNALWSSKLLVMCDEAFIDKKKVIERIKSLSTADRIVMNAKGKDQVEVDFFAKFILLSNNEENFANIDAPEVRFWVRKVPVIQDSELEVDLLQTMREEIPAFLHMLDHRQLATENLFRAWFDPKLIRTDALDKVVEYNKPTVIKELSEYLREVFFRAQTEEILMDADDVRHYVFGGNRYERNYLNKLIGKEMAINRFTRDGREVTKDYEFPAYEVKRDPSTGSAERVKLLVKGNGRPFVFKRSEFIHDEEWGNHHFESVLQKPTPPGMAGRPNDPDDDDLPF